MVRPDKGKIDKETYAAYHLRFSEMLLAHFAEEFSIFNTVINTVGYFCCRHWRPPLNQSGDFAK
jgi:hypothetical protein